MQVDWAQLYALIAPTPVVEPMGPLGQALRQLTEARLQPEQHGDLTRWAQLIQALPSPPTEGVLERQDLAAPCPVLGKSWEVDPRALRGQLEAFKPWRKGPFEIAGISIDAEWRCDVKWQRLSPHVDLKGRRVLDVGSGNGYFCLRALGAGAESALGIDPSIHYVMQFAALRHFCQHMPALVLPLALEQFPKVAKGFDVVLSMGVLYHRRSPLEHLLQLKQLVRKGGQVVLETLVVPGAVGYSLMPEERYAGMRNVWFIPTRETLLLWMRRLGFQNCRVLDESPTTSKEQRVTAWSSDVSLQDFLQPGGNLTLEGHPPPVRLMCTAQVP